MSAGGFLCVLRLSSCAPVSAEDGAVEALLWRDELSVEVVLVVFEEPLPLQTVSKSGQANKPTAGPARPHPEHQHMVRTGWA